MRKFIYDGRQFPDPDPNMTPDEVRQSMAQFFPELANAEVIEAKQGDDTVYDFKRRVGTKGNAPVPECRFCEHLKNIAGPRDGRYIGSCEYLLSPLTCGKYALDACFGGHEPGNKVVVEEVTITGPDGQSVKDPAGFLKILQRGVVYIPQKR